MSAKSFLRDPSLTRPDKSMRMLLMNTDLRKVKLTNVNKTKVDSFIAGKYY